VGRGTFVIPANDRNIRSTALASNLPATIDMGLNYPAGVEAEQALGKAFSHLIGRESPVGLLGLSPYEGRRKHREAGARWLRQFGLSVNGEQVLLCTSVQHGLAATLAALTSPGDSVLTEHLSSPGIKAVAAMHQLKLVAVAGDGKGILPEALLDASRTSGARALYTMPTLHTPTTTTMPDERRKEIAEVIRKKQLIAIEDDAWGFLAEGSVTPLHMFCRENVVYLTSTSKALAPGLRVGFVVAPTGLQRGIASCVGNMTWTAPLTAEIVARWIEDGTARSIMGRRVEAARKRKALAEKLLGAAITRCRLPTYHLWLPLPEPWRVDQFVNHAAAVGVSLVSSDLFVPGRAATPQAIRICTGTEPNLDRVETGIRTLARMLKSGPAGYSVLGV
jgi:DNA-binding transcriptional MocR family regulator